MIRIVAVIGYYYLVTSTMSVVYAQQNTLQQVIVLNKDTYTVRHLLEQVLPAQGVNITYHDNIIPLKKEISFKHLEVILLQDILISICKNQALDFEEIDGQILLKYYDRPQSSYSYTFNGIVEDKKTGEPLIGATLYVKNLKSGIATNGYGFYAFTLQHGEYQIIVSYIGYQPITYQINLNKNLSYKFKLSENIFKLNDVVIEQKAESNMKVQNILSSTNKLDMEMAHQIPYLGEVDVFQSTLLLPGISNVGEGVSGINVRGGSSDQNLIILDEAVIYNANHFFGLVSIFNPDAVKNVEILKGDFPAKYGGRNSSVMHVRQKEGNDKEFHLSGGLGIITSRLMVEGPALKGQANYLISGRSTIWGFILKNLSDAVWANSRVSFQDFNAKLKFNLNDKNKLYFSTYLGVDANKIGTDALKKWGNNVVSVRWNSVYGSRNFMNLTSYFSEYKYQVIEESKISNFVGTSRITDYAIKLDFTTYLTPKNLFDYGMKVVLHQMRPGERVPGEGSAVNSIKLATEYGLGSSLYLSNERQFGSFTTISVGMRYSSFYNFGTSSTGQTTSNLQNTSEEKKTYHIFSPRLSLKVQLNPRTSIKAGYYHTAQYLHLLSNTLSPSSSDTWKISGQYIKPTIMRQSTLGFYKFIDLLKLDVSAELFYRKTQNVIDYKNGANLFFNQAIQDELLLGEERGYGMEVFMKRKFGQLTGWFGYTLSKTERKIDPVIGQQQINEGEYFPSNYDRTHDISVTAIYQFSPKFSFSTNFLYYTGRPYSFPDSKYEIDGMLVPHFPNRNLDRLSDYHRLDIAAMLKSNIKRKKRKKKGLDASWIFSLYNVYARKNAQTYFFRESNSMPNTPVIEQLSVLGFLILSVTFNFKF